MSCISISFAFHMLFHFQEIAFHFTHLELGSLQNGDCSEKEDRVVIHWSDRRTGDPQSICVKPNTKTILAHSNTATVSFITNSEVDAQGFRLFYSEGKYS